MERHRGTIGSGRTAVKVPNVEYKPMDVDEAVLQRLIGESVKYMRKNYDTW